MSSRAVAAVHNACGRHCSCKARAASACPSRAYSAARKPTSNFTLCPTSVLFNTWGRRSWATSAKVGELATSSSLSPLMLLDSAGMLHSGFRRQWNLPTMLPCSTASTAISMTRSLAGSSPVVSRSTTAQRSNAAANAASRRGRGFTDGSSSRLPPGWVLAGGVLIAKESRRAPGQAPSLRQLQVFDVRFSSPPNRVSGAEKRAIRWYVSKITLMKHSLHVCPAGAGGRAESRMQERR